MTTKDLAPGSPLPSYPSRKVSTRSENNPRFEPERLECLTITFKNEMDLSKRVMKVVLPRRLTLRFDWWKRSKQPQGKA